MPSYLFFISRFIIAKIAKDRQKYLTLPLKEFKQFKQVSGQVHYPSSVAFPHQYQL